MANRYWRGGTGTWNTTSTTNWSATSGGSGGASVPTTADDVFFDANSGTGTVTMTGALACNSLTSTGSSFTFATGTTPTLACKNFTLSSTTVWNSTATITFSTGASINTNGVSLASPIRMSGTVTLANNLTTTSTFTNVSNFTLVLSTYTFTCLTFTYGATATEAINFGTGSKVVITGNNSTVFTIDSNASYTGTPIFEFSYSGSTGTRTILVDSNKYSTYIPTLKFTAGSDIVTFSLSSAGSTLYVNDLDFTGFSGTFNNIPSSGSGSIYCAGSLTLSSTMTLLSNTTTFYMAAQTAGKTITTNGKTINFPLVLSGKLPASWTLQDNLNMLSTRSFTLGEGTLTLGNYNLNLGTIIIPNGSAATIDASGTGKINIANSGSNVINISNDVTIVGNCILSLNYSGSVTTSASIQSSKTNGRFSLNVTAGTYTFTMNNATVLDLNFTGFSGSIGSTQNAISVYGDVIFSSTMTVNIGVGSNFLTFSKVGAQSLTSNGVDINSDINILQLGTNLTIQDNLIAGNIKFSNASGTSSFDANNKNLTITSYSPNSGSITNMGSGTWSLTGTGGLWSAPTTGGSATATINQGTSTIIISNSTNNSSRTFAGDAYTFNNLVIGGGTATGQTTVLNGGTFNSISSTKTVAHTITLSLGSALYVYDWTVTGTAGNIVTINSSSAGSPSTMYKLGGGIVSINYVSIKDSYVDPTTATWYAGANSTNVSGNSGWIFSAPPKSNFFMFF